MRPRYIAIVINAAVLLWLFHASVAAYVHYFTDPEWLAYGVADQTSPLYVIRWTAVLAAFAALFIRRPWAVPLLVVSHLVLLSGPIGGAVGLAHLVPWSEISAPVITGWCITAGLSLLALAPLASKPVRCDLAGMAAAA